ncbi:hypothetical protein BH11PLA2_BH11PLA2_30120 [soil metagenome]
MTSPDEIVETPPTVPTPVVENSTDPVVEAAAAPASTAEVVSDAVLPPPAPTPVPSVEPQPVPIVPKSPQHHELSRIAQDIQIRRAQVETVVQLLDEGNTVPFLTRYRKEMTGGLNEEQIRRIQDRVKALRHLSERKVTILRSIANQAKLNDDLVAAILAAEHPKRLEDLYLPFKPRKKSLAADAKEKGLEPLAQAIWNRDTAVDKLDEVLPGIVDPWKQLHDVNDVLTGVKNILAEYVADRADVRGALRAFLWDTAILKTKKIETVPEAKAKDYAEYFDFAEPVVAIPPHRVLAVNRGERENVIRVNLDADATIAVEITSGVLGLVDHPHKDMLLMVAKDAVERLMLPSLDREIRRDLTDRSQDHAVHIFAKNLRGLLMQPPLRGKKVLAIDPGLRSGCKLAVLDETGAVLEDAVVFPHQPRKDAETAKKKLEQLIRKHQTTVIAIGNGTACRETESLVSDLIAEFANRKLSPTATVSTDPPVTSESKDAGAPPTETTSETPAETAAEKITEPAAPAMPTTEMPVSVFEPMTSMMELSSPLGAAETSIVDLHVGLPEGSVVTTGTTATADTIAAQVVMTTAEPATTAAAAPPPPVIDLTGLPDAPDGLAYVIVNEAGASDYSASPIARDEFPNFDATVRGTISIGRRLQDPLSELVKIDPQHVGVGLYQHDLKPKHMRESLEAVIESCVNHIGVDLNTASVPLLRHVSGLNQLAAREIVAYRTANGPFKSREALKSVPQFGDARFTQAAGFLKIQDGDEPLDKTWIHPENYALTKVLLAELGFGPRELNEKARVEALRAKLNTVDLEAVSKKLDASPALVDDIFAALARPGRDPREDLPPPIFKTGIMKLEDITPGMEMKGTVQNVVPFGAFVDIGVKESGLIHISQLANRYIKSPHDLVSVGDVVTVWVIEVKASEKKISLTMIPPKRERPREERPQFDEQRPPRGDRFQSDRPQGDRPQGDRPPQRGDRPQGDRPPMRGDRPPQGRDDGQGGGRQPQRRSFDRRPSPQYTPQEQLPPPPPPKPKAPVKLTEEKKTGKAALNTFGELSALFKLRKEDPPAPPTETPPETPASS